MSEEEVVENPPRSYSGALLPCQYLLRLGVELLLGEPQRGAELVGGYLEAGIGLAQIGLELKVLRLGAVEFRLLGGQPAA